MPEPTLPWNHPDLAVKSDPPTRAKYRLLQSWYRENVLHAPYGTDGKGKPIGSRLAVEAVEVDPNLNFLNADVAAYVAERVPQVRAEAGALDEHRLRRNMLSSQPLCFNVFGAIRTSPALPGLLGGLLDLDIAEIECVKCEWAPQPPTDHLDDKTAFDGYIEYRTGGGERGFLGIETKYTEPFSQHAWPGSKYVEVTDGCGWFRPGAAERLVGVSTNQLWRNVMLAASTCSKFGFTQGAVVVLCLAGDKHAKVAIEGVRAELLEPDDHLRETSLEAMIQAAAAVSELAGWATAFSRRYLDLGPLDGA